MRRNWYIETTVREKILPAPFLFALMVLLLGIGLIFIYTTGMQSLAGANSGPFLRQLVWIGLGGVAYFLLTSFDYREWDIFIPFCYVGCILLLIAVLFFGTKIYGARRWLDLGVMNLQPSELTKLVLVLLLARMLSYPEFDVNAPFNWLKIGGAVAVPFLLIFREPDLGSAMLLLLIAAIMVFAAGLKGKYIAAALVATVLLGGLFVANEYFRFKPLLRDYHRERIQVFFHPESDSLGRSYQQLQARLALGSGGWGGKGIGKGTQHLLGFLPQSASNNDFIFSVIAEELGFFGSTMLLFVYLAMLGTILFVGTGASDLFGQMLCTGIAAFFFVHVAINISVNIGLMPVKGLSLPLVSYGGSFVFICMAALGIVQSVARFGKEE